MSSWYTFPMLLAEDDRFQELEALRRGFVRQALDSNWVAVGAALVALLALTLVIDRLARPAVLAGRPKPVDYLAAAGQLIGLSRRELRLLRTIATGAGLSQPASMLLSPANLAHAARIAKPIASAPGVWEQLDAVALRLFGAKLAPEAHDAGPT